MNRPSVPRTTGCTSFAKRTSEREEPSAAIIEISPVRTENTTGELSGYIIVTMRSAPERRMNPAYRSIHSDSASSAAPPAPLPRQRSVSSDMPSPLLRCDMKRLRNHTYPSSGSAAAGTESHAARPPRLAVSDGTRRSAGTSSVTEHSAMS